MSFDILKIFSLLLEKLDFFPLFPYQIITYNQKYKISTVFSKLGSILLIIIMMIIIISSIMDISKPIPKVNFAEKQLEDEVYYFENSFFIFGISITVPDPNITLPSQPFSISKVCRNKYNDELQYYVISEFKSSEMDSTQQVFHYVLDYRVMDCYFKKTDRYFTMMINVCKYDITCNMDYIQIDISFYSAIINTDEQKNPFSTVQNAISITRDPNSSNVVQFFYQKVKFESDDGFFFSKKNYYESFKFVQFYSYRRYSLDRTNKYIYIDFNLDNNMIVYTRYYDKIQDLFSKIGGSANFIVFIIAFVVGLNSINDFKGRILKEDREFNELICYHSKTTRQSSDLKGCSFYWYKIKYYFSGEKTKLFREMISFDIKNLASKNFLEEKANSIPFNDTDNKKISLNYPENLGLSKKISINLKDIENKKMNLNIQSNLGTIENLVPIKDLEKQN